MGEHWEVKDLIERTQELDAFQWKAATGFRKIGYVKVSASA
jgi:hypothetical protein